MKREIILASSSLMIKFEGSFTKEKEEKKLASPTATVATQSATSNVVERFIIP